MLAGSMGWLKSTAISRLVAMPPLWGTTIDTVGPTAVGTGGLATPPQLRKKNTASGAVKILESWRIDIRFLSQYLGEFVGVTPGSKPRLSGHAKQA
jgi:hypothetical protein